jgi:hypothetical protein
MHEVFYGAMPMQAIAMCILMNVALVLSIAALIKYLIKGKCACGRGCVCKCGCACCNQKPEGASADAKSCCK